MGPLCTNFLNTPFVSCESSGVVSTQMINDILRGAHHELSQK